MTSNPHTELREAALAVALSGVGHAITIFPAAAEPDLFDWRCSCRRSSSGSYFGDFGRAAGDALRHVPPNPTVVITRPAAEVA